jgi:hypothetical protein
VEKHRQFQQQQQQQQQQETDDSRLALPFSISTNPDMELGADWGHSTLSEVFKHFQQSEDVESQIGSNGGHHGLVSNSSWIDSSPDNFAAKREQWRNSQVSIAEDEVGDDAGVVSLAKQRWQVGWAACP